MKSEKFAGDIPPLKNFKTPKSIEAGSTCSIACDWGIKPQVRCARALS